MVRLGRFIRFSEVKCEGGLMSATGKDRIGTIPMMVRAAKEINFGISVTAYLCHVSFRGRCAVGIVFCDVFGRFEDGHGIHTSNIMSKVMVGSHTILRTVNSVYIVCSWSGEGLETRMCHRLH
jgi:hypothetical protein